ncbi:hydrolase [Microbacterium sp. H1-D42]|uniref:hydrolase n=1 Tax=Microbacterium sp. H1-D42 TaxID=2925844 RepID=UPI001F52F124|nr:hydrolase [Microbacterium sp. H1-D42]UNK71513.1 hydrolase [Microbacterium sp. H1-D42]
MKAVRFFDGATVREGTLTSDTHGWRLSDDEAPAGTARLPGLITGLFTDHHVHLQLIDPAGLLGSRLGTVVDLGAEIGWISDLSDDLAERDTLTVRYAGPFLTAVGGYPSDRDWAPTGSVHQIIDADDAAAIVADLAAEGVSFLKIVGNSDAGPVLRDDLLRTLAHLAAEHRIPLVAHAEGPGQAQRVVRLGATRLAHSPFSERLTDDEIGEQAASASWISTMAIHDGEALAIVTDNVRRFFAAGGEVVYGSDMGNGPTPVDLREAEIDALRAAGIDGLDLLSTLDPADPLVPGTPLLLLPDADPNRARRLTTTDLEP